MGPKGFGESALSVTSRPGCKGATDFSERQRVLFEMVLWQKDQGAPKGSVGEQILGFMSTADSGNGVRLLMASGEAVVLSLSVCERRLWILGLGVRVLSSLSQGPKEKLEIWGVGEGIVGQEKTL